MRARLQKLNWAYIFKKIIGFLDQQLDG